MTEPNTAPLDCLIVGGGPAGITAAIYLARFHLRVRVVDAGNSRVLWIPCTHNHAGYPDGISGADLLAAMVEQARRYNVPIENGRVMRVEREGELFVTDWGQGPVAARTVLLATGIQNRRPQCDEDLHAEALASGHIRYCPVCDGYEVTDKRVGVIGTGGRGVAEAVFLRSYTADVTVIESDGPLDLDAEARERAADAGLTLVDGPATIVGIEDGRLVVETPSGRHSFDSVYPALGSDSNNTIARQLQAELAGDACVVVDNRQRTTVPGLYAAGDIVQGLDQISHAMGEGGVAATTIRNDLSRQVPLLRAAA